MERNVLIEKISSYLGCSLSIAELYYFILEKPCTSQKIDDIFSNSIDNLEWLLSKCLISEYVDERTGGGKVYFAIDPQYSLSAVLLNKAWKRDSELHSLDVLKSRTDVADLYSNYLLFIELSSELQNKYKRQLPYVKEIVVIVKGKKKMASCLAAQIADVQKSIIAMVSPPQLMGEIVWQTVKDKMFDGINYHRITDFDEIVRHGFEIARLEAEEYNEEIYIFTGKQLPEKFYILDGQSVIFFEKNKSKTKYLQRIQIVKNAGVATQFLERYKKILTNCIDFRTLIPQIRNYRKALIQKADGVIDKEIRKWLIDIFDNGVFYSKGKYSVSFLEQAISICKEKGFIRFLEDESIVVNYGIKDVLSE